MRGVRELGRGGLAMDGDLVPGRCTGAGAETETHQESGKSPKLGSGWDKKDWCGQVCRSRRRDQRRRETTFLLGKRTANTPSGINVHPVGKEGLLLMLQAGLGVRVVGLGVEREARNGVGLVATA